MPDVTASLEEYRGMREALEAALLPLATSVDGRRFNFQVSLHGLELEPGGYVAIEGDGSSRLGQLLSLELRHQDANTRGPGRTASALAPGTGSSSQGADSCSTTPRCVVPPRTRWARGSRVRPDGAQLDVGGSRSPPACRSASIPAASAATPSCVANRAQGRPLPLGVLLKRLLMETNLRVVVLDPNSDYVRLGEPRVDDERYRDAAASVQVRRLRR